MLLEKINSYYMIKSSAISKKMRGLPEKGHDIVCVLYLDMDLHHIEVAFVKNQ